MVVNLKQIGGDAILHIVENNIIPMSALEKGDRFYIPKNPIWLAEQRGTNANSRAHVLAVFLVDNTMIVKPVYFNQLARVDRETKKLVMSDKVNATTYRGGSKAFNKLAAGKILTVNEVNEDVNDFSYDANGQRNLTEDGKPMYTKTKAFGYKVEDGKGINDAEVAKAVEEYLKDTYVQIDPTDEPQE